MTHYYKHTLKVPIGTDAYKTNQNCTTYNFGPNQNMFSESDKNTALKFTAAVGTTNGELEIEVRFREYSKRTGVTKATFDRLIDLYSGGKREDIPWTHSKVYLQEKGHSKKHSLRKVVWYDEDKIVDTEWQYKISTEPIYKSLYGMTLNMSTEKSVNPQKSFKPLIVRDRRRVTFTRGNVDIDLTISKQQDVKGGVPSTKYEVEAEINNIGDFDSLSDVALEINKEIQNTNRPYTITKHGDILEYVNTILGQTSSATARSRLDSRKMTKPRNLHYSDIKYGGLVGSNITHYHLLHKTDGVRKLLVIAFDALWLISPPANIDKMASFTDKTAKWLNGYIFDGESVPIESRTDTGPTTEYFYMIFDTISIPSTGDNPSGDSTIQFSNYSERLLAAKAVEKVFEDTEFTIKVKKSYPFVYVDDFYRETRAALEREPRLDYHTDGFLFVPERLSTNTREQQYLPNVRGLSKKDRTLLNVPDLCKYKPPHQVTIDFKVVISDGSLSLFSSDGGNIKEFSAPYPVEYNINMVEVTEELMSRNGNVVEFAFNDGKLYPIRVRYDKEWPNSMTVARDNWALMHNPITYETMTGNDTVLMSKYHNKVKTTMFSKSAESFTSKPTLLDLGAGRGGDVAKWIKLYSRAVLVEPNKDYVDELIRRLSGYTKSYVVVRTKAELSDSIKKNRVLVLVTKAENHSFITTAIKKFLSSKVDVVSSMFSLSFFWSSKSVFDGLVKTIKRNISPRGEFTFVTIDGDKVDEAFRPIFGRLEVEGEPVFNRGNISLKYNPPTLTIDLEGTIVENQKEWLVRIDNLQSALAPLKLVDVSSLTKEQFLSEGSRTLTKMYTAGRFVPATAQVANRIKIPVDKVHYDVEPWINRQDYVEEIRQEESTVDAVHKSTVKSSSHPIILKRRKMQRRAIGGMFVKHDVDTDSGIGDDQVQRLDVKWYKSNPVVRISCISENSALFHALLKCFYDVYASSSSYSERLVLVAKYRRDIAMSLSSEVEGKDGTTHTVFEDAADGMYVHLYRNQYNTGKDTIDSAGNNIDYSMEGLMDILNSNRQIGYELHGLIKRLYYIDIYVVKGFSEDIVLQHTTHGKGVDASNAIVIMGDHNNYQLVGVDTADGIVTLFPADHEFIVNLYKLCF